MNNMMIHLLLIRRTSQLHNQGYGDDICLRGPPSENCAAADVWNQDGVRQLLLLYSVSLKFVFSAIIAPYRGPMHVPSPSPVLNKALA